MGWKIVTQPTDSNNWTNTEFLGCYNKLFYCSVLGDQQYCQRKSSSTAHCAIDCITIKGPHRISYGYN